MAGRRISAGYYRRYDGKVVYVISLATDADTGEESVIWTTYPFADVPKYYTSSKKSFCAFIEVNGERKAKYKRMLNMKISGEAIERLEEEGFRGPVRGWPVHSQVGRSPSTEPWQRGLSAKEILLCSGLSAERAGRGGGNMPAAETSTKVNNPTSNGASATKQALRFSVKCMSVGYIFPNTSRETTRTPSKGYVKTMSHANVCG